MITAASSLVPANISSSLEDYLETIYLLVQQQGFARVKEIAHAREVKAASVSVALRRLAELDLVRYERREYIALTEQGEEAARKVLTRHRLLTRFFEEVLQMPADAASNQACAMEHSLTDEAMDRFVRFFEYLGSCPTVIESFRRCPLSLAPDKAAARKDSNCATCRAHSKVETMSLADLRPGQHGVVEHINAKGALRQRLLDMGMLPQTPIELERAGLGGDPLWIRCQGARLALRRAEASSIAIRQLP